MASIIVAVFNVRKATTCASSMLAKLRCSEPPLQAAPIQIYCDIKSFLLHANQSISVFALIVFRTRFLITLYFLRLFRPDLFYQLFRQRLSNKLKHTPQCRLIATVYRCLILGSRCFSKCTCLCCFSFIHITLKQPTLPIIPLDTLSRTVI